MKELKRNSSIELLRIIAMLGVVLSHWGGHGSWTNLMDSNYIFNKTFIQYTQLLGEVSNCFFILITGYFMYKRTRGIKGILYLVGDITFYSIAILIVGIKMGFIIPSISAIVYGILPIIYKQYWFFVPYIALVIISPLINKCIELSDKKQLQLMFGFLIVVELILPMINSTTVASNFGLFILIYSIGAILNRESIAKKVKETKIHIFAIASAIMILITIIMVMICNILQKNFGLNPSLCNMAVKVITGRFSIFPIMISVPAFICVSRLSFKNRFINLMAGSVFAVYTISENINIYPWFWKKYADNIVYYNKPYMIFIALAQCLIIMLICIGIDLLYRAVKHLVKILKLRICQTHT